MVVGLRPGSGSAAEVERAGIAHLPPVEAVSGADLIMLLAPDETLAEIYAELEPHIRNGAALGFSHGLAIRFGLIAAARATST